MRIYTRTGDDGTTSVFGGKRLSKADIQVNTYGCLDELSSTLGVLLAHIDKEEKEEIQFIKGIQQDLHSIMGFFAHAPIRLEKQNDKIILFENKIDELTKKLPKLAHFVLPNGSLVSCWAHMARVVCRKAERTIVLYFQKKKCIEHEESRIIMKFMNRLSDLLFTYARIFNE